MDTNQTLVISGTNRPNSMTRKVANFYSGLMQRMDKKHGFISLEELPQNMFENDMYFGKVIQPFIDFQKDNLYGVKKYVMIVPEYNGSYPGIFKAFIDACDVAKCFHNKKVCLVGVAAGRAGNLRGMDHLTNIFNHIKMEVLPLKIPLSSIGTVLNEENQITNPETILLLETQIRQFDTF